jgi:hypothetical protein
MIKNVILNIQYLLKVYFKKKFDSFIDYNKHLQNGNFIILDEKYLYGEFTENEKKF